MWTSGGLTLVCLADILEPEIMPNEQKDQYRSIG